MDCPTVSQYASLFPIGTLAQEKTKAGLQGHFTLVTHCADLLQGKVVYVASGQDGFDLRLFPFNHTGRIHLQGGGHHKLASDANARVSRDASLDLDRALVHAASVVRVTVTHSVISRVVLLLFPSAALCGAVVPEEA
jgi:hypothetical protein